MSETNQRLENYTDFVKFERLCCDLLSVYGYEGIIPRGLGKIDGGIDAVLIDRNDNTATCNIKTTIFHFSTRRDYERKLKEDLNKTREKGYNPSQVVFVTNRRIEPLQQDKLKKGDKEEYQWDLTIHDQEWLRIPLDTDYQRIRKTYLGIDYDLKFFSDLEILLQNPRKHPNLNDFKKGLYYLNKEYHDSVSEHLESRRLCLITGGHGSGKTALARGIGYHFLKESPQNMVLYLSTDEKSTSEQWLEQIQHYDHPYVLYIIDNCHNAIDETNAFIERQFEVKKAKILLLSRWVNPDLAGTTDENYITIMQDERIRLDIEVTEETIKAIINKLSNSPEAKAIGDINRIFQKCEGDLHLLNFYISAWQKKEIASPLSDIGEEEILDDVYNHYLEARTYINQTLAICALWRFEIPVESAWICVPASIDAIQKDGFIEGFTFGVYEHPVHFFKYFHSTPANYILKAAYEKGILRKSVIEYIKDMIIDYLSTSPANLFEISPQMYKNNGQEILVDIYKDGKLLKIIGQFINEKKQSILIGCLLGISKTLRGIWTWEGKNNQGIAYNLLQDLVKRLHGNEWHEVKKFGEVSAIMSHIRGIDEEFIKKTLESLDFKALVERSKDVGLITVINFLRLTTQAGVDKARINNFCDGLDFKALGERSKDVGLATVMNFLQLTNQAGVNKAGIKDFCDSLDFKALGKHSQDVGLATVRRFIELTSQAGVNKARINDFCDGLDFKALGERSKDVGLATVRAFIELTNQAGVNKARIKDFCDSLDFKALGNRSKDVGLSTVKRFIELTNQAGVNKARINDFCDGLDFKALGKRSKDVGLATVMNFLQLTTQAGVNKARINDFCDGLDWNALGKDTKKESGELKKLFFYLHLILSNNAISSDMAKQFIEGIGWEDLSQAIEGQFSPDILEIIWLLLIKKCQFTFDDLNSRAIDLRPRKIWLRAFINNPCQKVQGKRSLIQKNCLNRAFKRLICQKDIKAPITQKSEVMDLRSWNVFIHNLLLADMGYIEKEISPILKGLSGERFESLFCQTDLQNIGIFLSRFNPKDGVFKWSISREINFKKIDFLQKIEGVSLEAIAHFLFNFYFIDRGDCSHYFACLLNENPDKFISKTAASDLTEIGFFLWNHWLAMPKDSRPFFVENKEILRIIKEKAKSEKQKDSIQQVIGVLSLIGTSPSDELKRLVSSDEATLLCQEAIKNNSVTAIRLLAGLSEIADSITEDDKDVFMQGINNFMFSTEIPNQLASIEKIRKWLCNVRINCVN